MVIYHILWFFFPPKHHLHPHKKDPTEASPMKVLPDRRRSEEELTFIWSVVEEKNM